MIRLKGTGPPWGQERKEKAGIVRPVPSRPVNQKAQNYKENCNRKKHYLLPSFCHLKWSTIIYEA